MLAIIGDGCGVVGDTFGITNGSETSEDKDKNVACGKGVDGIVTGGPNFALLFYMAVEMYIRGNSESPRRDAISLIRLTER